MLHKWGELALENAPVPLSPLMMEEANYLQTEEVRSPLGSLKDWYEPEKTKIQEDQVGCEGNLELYMSGAV